MGERKRQRLRAIVRRNEERNFRIGGALGAISAAVIYSAHKSGDPKLMKDAVELVGAIFLFTGPKKP